LMMSGYTIFDVVITAQSLDFSRKRNKVGLQQSTNLQRH